MKQTFRAAIWIAFSVLTASGQGTTQAPEFEVASVKKADPQAPGPPLAILQGPMGQMIGFEGGPGSPDPGRINYHGVTLKNLLARAYNVRPDQVSGPDWLDTERYTIIAKLPPTTNTDQLRLMLQKLLTERFQISLRHEVKEGSVYRLRVAKNGPKLEPPQKLPQYQNDDERKEAGKKQAEEMLSRMKARVEANARSGVRMNSRSFSLASATMEKFASTLSSHLDRPVRDMTQLEGEFSFRLAWNPEGNSAEDSPGVSIFTAIQEQLGLRLESGKEPIELLVIDKAEKEPTSN
jgi:uncharacterized protein (TIGR03435 family)